MTDCCCYFPWEFTPPKVRVTTRLLNPATSGTPPAELWRADEWNGAQGTTNNRVVKGITFHSSGDVIVGYEGFGGANGIRRRFIVDGTEVWNTSGECSIRGVACDSSGNVYVGHGDTLRQLSGADGSELWSVVIPGTLVDIVGIASDGTHVYVAVNSEASPFQQGHVRKFDSDGNEITDDDWPFQYPGSNMKSIDTSPSASGVFVGVDTIPASISARISRHDKATGTITGSIIFGGSAFQNESLSAVPGGGFFACDPSSLAGGGSCNEGIQNPAAPPPALVMVPGGGGGFGAFGFTAHAVAADVHARAVLASGLSGVAYHQRAGASWPNPQLPAVWTDAILPAFEVRLASDGKIAVGGGRIEL